MCAVNRPWCFWARSRCFIPLGAATAPCEAWISASCTPADCKTAGTVGQPQYRCGPVGSDDCCEWGNESTPKHALRARAYSNHASGQRTPHTLSCCAMSTRMLNLAPESVEQPPAALFCRLGFEGTTLSFIMPSIVAIGAG